MYAVNKFGYFSPGLVFEILQYIKDNYLSLQVLAVSKGCKKYIEDFVTPLRAVLHGKSKDVANISDDVGRNNELAREGKPEF